MTARELLAAVRAAQGLPSNYALARVIGVTDTTVTRWNVGSNTPDDLMAQRLATMAGLDPDSVVAAMHAQRSHNPDERALWQRIAERLAAPALVALGAILTLWTTGGPDGGAYLLASALPLLVHNGFDGLYIVACCVTAFLTLRAARRALILAPECAAPIAA